MKLYTLHVDSPDEFVTTLHVTREAALNARREHLTRLNALEDVEEPLASELDEDHWSDGDIVTLITEHELDLTSLGHEKISELDEVVRERVYATLDALIVAKVYKIVEKEFGPAKGVATKVKLTTWDWDNGWFFNSSAEVTFKTDDGDGDDIADIDLSEIDKELADLSSQSSIGPNSTAIIDLDANTVTVDTYDQD